MHLLVIDHKPKNRHKYPSDWKVVGPTRIAAIITDGEYWYETCKRWPITESIKLEDLRTGHIKT